MMGAKCAIILVMILYLSTIQASDLECRFETIDELKDGGIQTRRVLGSDYFIKCTDDKHAGLDTIPNNFFTSNAARLKKEHVSKIHALGEYDELILKSSFDWLYSLRISSKNLKVFDLSKYEDNTRLQDVSLRYTYGSVTVKLNSKIHLDDLYLYNIKEVNIECASLKASKLKSLRASESHLIGFNFGCLPQEIQVFKLSNNAFNSFDGLDSLQKLTNLEVINLENSGLESFNLTNLPASVTKLDLSGNNLGTLETIQLKRLLNLKILNLGNTGLKSFNLANLPAPVTQLDLSGNNLEPLKTLPLKGLLNLENLYLGNTGLKSFNVKNIPASVTELTLSYNSLRSFDVKRLSPNIKSLSLTNCDLTIDASLFSTYKQLELLDLYGNKDENGNSLGIYSGSRLKKLLFGDDYDYGDDAAAPSPNSNTPDDVDPKTGDDDSKVDDDDKVVDDQKNSCRRNHVFMPLIVVICVRIIVTFL